MFFFSQKVFNLTFLCSMIIFPFTRYILRISDLIDFSSINVYMNIKIHSFTVYEKKYSVTTLDFQYTKKYI